VIPPGALLFSSPSGQPVPFGSYTGPTGTQDVSGVEWLSGEPAGPYTFTLGEYAGPQAYVTGADLTTP